MEDKNLRGILVASKGGLRIIWCKVGIDSSDDGDLAAKAGATYVSPFVGRLDDISHTGMELVAQMLEIYQNYIFETEILVASIRNPLHVLEAAQMGADVATIPFKVIAQLAQHPLTDIGMKKFLDDWKRVEST